ncbi:hypothetical protein AB835_11995 [Candidatus Endobugula sertula]|uniref:Glycoside hydrolase family 42 N-terminal domain-containing protein n=1 Tax=Candidatus Endobugula sertula TaxID=62101 RepID=A0A1D2QMM3_9GAMM|nr:hypothetical protein AB835_11995 [Candidatus Endobugula sertula]
MKTAILWICLSYLSLSTHSFADYVLAKTGNQRFLLMDNNEQPVVTIEGLVFKPKWQWTSSTLTETQPNNKKIDYTYKIDNGNIQWKLGIEPINKQVAIRSQLHASTVVPLTYIALSLKPEPALDGGKLIATNNAQQVFVLPLPLQIKELNNIMTVSLQDKSGNTKATFHFSHPLDIHTHGQARLKLADKQMAAKQITSNTITINTGQTIRFYNDSRKIPNNTNHHVWFPFQPKNTIKPSAFGMQEWLNIPDEPLTLQGNKILSGNTTYKVWGTNVEYTHNAPNKQDAIKRAHFFAKYGINSVRLHKLTNPGWEGLGNNHSASEYNDNKLRRFDYWTYQLRKQGITYGFSPIWDLKVLPGDKEKLAAYEEILQAAPHKPVTTGLVWFAEDVQNLHIATLINLLQHKNPYTGLSYATDPALAYVELQNEENSFFYSFMNKVRRHPTYHQMLAGQFSDWLEKKYGSETHLIEQWGQGALNTFSQEGGLPNEQLSQRNITPVISPWLYDNHATQGRRAKRLQDSAEFLFEKQQQYYQRATQAIRATGFTGPIVAGNWQAGSKGAHFLNLLADANSGIVDRHNYQGGATGQPGHLMDTGFGFSNDTMLGDPGSGLLSMGMQQIAERPFMMSEWLAVLPSEWAAADTAIVATYGFGLQGWDISYHFASNGNGFSDTLGHGDGKGKFNNLTPLGVGLYPVLSRMVLRGDVKEADPIAIRRLSKDQAIRNDYDFQNTVSQQHDIKSLSGTPHHNALAAGKILIEFTQQKGRSTITPWKQKYQTDHNNHLSTIRSSTGELSWTANKKTQRGYIKINTPGTQGIIGFSDNKLSSFNDMSIQVDSPYAVILATAKHHKKKLSNDNEAIIVAMARAHNTNMNLKSTIIAHLGTAPVILEPVKATLNFQRKKGTIIVLDHDGIPTGKTYPLNNGTFQLDTGRDRSPYYLVTFDR